MNYIKSCGYSTSWFILHDYHVKLAPSNRQADKQRIELFLLAMKIFLCWWCWAGLCCWIKILLNPSCPCQQPYFGLNTTGKHSNTTGKFEISRGDGDGAGEGVVELRFSWIHLAAVSSHLSPESACRDSRNSQTSDVFFWNTHFSCTVLFYKNPTQRNSQPQMCKCPEIKLY